MNLLWLALSILGCSSGGSGDADTASASPTDDTACLPNIFVSPAEFHFAANAGESDEELVTVTNYGCGTLNVEGVRLADEEQPYVLSALGAVILPSRQSTTFTITFAPTEAGEFNTSIHIESNDPDAPSTSVLLYGVASAG